MTEPEEPFRLAPWALGIASTLLIVAFLALGLEVYFWVEWYSRAGDVLPGATLAEAEAQLQARARIVQRALARQRPDRTVYVYLLEPKPPRLSLLSHMFELRVALACDEHGVVRDTSAGP